MEKIKIHIGIIGYLPFDFDRKKILHWKSEIFKITDVSEFSISTKRSDTSNWEYSDETLNTELPKRKNADIFIGFTYLPLQGRFYIRRLDDNRVIVSLFEVHEDLTLHNIPIENLLLRMVYAASLVYHTELNVKPSDRGRIDMLHDDTRGCIYDMTGNISDVIHSLNKPKLCGSCIEILRGKKVSNEIINSVNSELKLIRRERYYRIEAFIKKKPLLSISITFIAGIIMSMTANLLYDCAKAKIMQPKTETQNETIKIKK